MKWYGLGAAALCCAAAYSQSLTGRWVGQASPYDNGLEFVLAVNQAADGSVTGYVQGGRFNDTITGGKVEGSNITLEAERPGRTRLCLPHLPHRHLLLLWLQLR